MLRHISLEDTAEHRLRVYNLMHDLAAILDGRGNIHDFSKTVDPEVSVFDEFTPKLATSTYGSEEYKGFLAAMKPALDHHYAENRHHPEYFKLWKCPECTTIYPDESLGDGPKVCPWCANQIGQAFQMQPYVGVEGMTLIDLIEMLCDWKAASERHKDGDIMRSIEINAKRFSISDQLKTILQNTVREIVKE